MAIIDVEDFDNGLNSIHDGPGMNVPLLVKPYNMVFLHIPKNAGTTIRQWHYENFAAEALDYLKPNGPTRARYLRKAYHGGYHQVHGEENQSEGLINDSTHYWGVVRNPWDRMVSLWNFHGSIFRPWFRAQREADRAYMEQWPEGHPFREQLKRKIAKRNHHFKSKDELYDTFENFINISYEEDFLANEGAQIRNPKGRQWFYYHTNQRIWFQGIPQNRVSILRFENLTEDFDTLIRPRLGMKTGRLGKLNSTKRPSDYRDLYTSDTLIERVGEMFEADCAQFGYTFE